MQESSETKLFYTRLLLTVEITIVTGFIYLLGQFIYPVTIACILLYLSLPAINFLERSTHLPRYIAVISIFILQVIILAKLFYSGLPYLANELQSLLLKAPSYITQLIGYLNQQANLYQINIPIETEEVAQKTSSFFTNILSLRYETLEHTLLFAHGTASHLLSPVYWIIDTLLIPILYLFLGINYQNILTGLKNNTPHFLKKEMTLFLHKTNDIFDAYIRGQIILVCTLAACYSLGFYIISLPYGLSIGIITGLLSFIPYLGTIIGLTTATLILFTSNSSFYAYALLLIVFGTVHSLEYSVLIPRLVGHRVGLSTLTSFLAIIIGASNFGVFGIIFAIPTVAVGKHVFERVHYHCRAQQIV
jgi:predicted PurR-regulated permease PerM